MVRVALLPLLTAALVLGMGQQVLAADDDVVVQPAPSERGIVVQPGPSDTVVVEPPAAAPSGRTAVRREAAVQHDAEVSRLPGGAVASVENAVPGGTIVDVDKAPLMKSWEVKVVDPQGQVHKVHVDSNGQASNVRLDRSENDRVANLTSAQKSAVMQRFPDAVIYDSQIAIVNGKRADKVELLSQGQRYEVKVDRSTGEIYKVENESQEGEHNSWFRR